MADDIAAKNDFRFDDVRVGHTERSQTSSVTEAEINFAQQFDPLPIHSDRPAAMTSQFGGITASGSHMLALRQRLLHDFAYANGVIAPIGLNDVRYRAPLRADVPCWIEIEFLEKTPSRSKPDRGVTRVGIKMFADGEVVLTMIDVVLMRRDVPAVFDNKG